MTAPRWIPYEGGWIARDDERVWYLDDVRGVDELEVPPWQSDALVGCTLRTIGARPLAWSRIDGARLLEAMLGTEAAP